MYVFFFTLVPQIWSLSHLARPSLIGCMSTMHGTKGGEQWLWDYRWKYGVEVAGLRRHPPGNGLRRPATAAWPDMAPASVGVDESVFTACAWHR